MINFHVVYPISVFALFLWIGVGSPPVSAQPAVSGQPATEFKPKKPAAKASVYTYKKKSFDGIGKVYMGREISHVMGHLGIGWLERPEREREEKPQKVVDHMGLKPDSVVADIGAGSGYFSFRIAKKVPKGKVLAVDIQQEMLDEIEARKVTNAITNVVGVLGEIDDPKLGTNRIDFVLFVDAYHEFSHPHEMMTHIVKALKPGGRVIQIEYRAEDPTIRIKPLHKMTEAQAIKEMQAVGLRHVKTENFLPQQHFMVFEKPKEQAQRPRNNF